MSEPGLCTETTTALRLPPRTSPRSARRASERPAVSGATSCRTPTEVVLPDGQQVTRMSAPELGDWLEGLAVRLAEKGLL
ncbi:MAG: hypothetical protein COZ05_01455 [Armatimonadetes bacterium CG_4_10_14_3_um_filter_59_10]|nr:MAG: hypothetical protein COZ05_01455 [Armatimonadetes bacterium CG_4_10_14_3_um_filter_59_10]